MVKRDENAEKIWTIPVEIPDHTADSPGFLRMHGDPHAPSGILGNPARRQASVRTVWIPGERRQRPGKVHSVRYHNLHLYSDSVFDDILYYINQNYGQTLKLESIAPLFGYNSSYLASCSPRRWARASTAIWIRCGFQKRKNFWTPHPWRFTKLRRKWAIRMWTTSTRNSGGNTEKARQSTGRSKDKNPAPVLHDQRRADPAAAAAHDFLDVLFHDVYAFL